MADRALSPGDSAKPQVIRCAECRELVPADRVRYREEHVELGAAPAPGRWRVGGPPIFRRAAHDRSFTPDMRPKARAAPFARNISATERIPVCIDCLRRQQLGLYGVCAIVGLCFAVAVALYLPLDAPSSARQVAQLTSTLISRLTPPATATPTSSAALTAAQTPAPAEDDAADAPRRWQPIWDAAASLLSSATSALGELPSAAAQSSAELAPGPGPDTASPPVAIASAASPTPRATPEPRAPTAEPIAAPEGPAATDSSRSATEPSPDFAEAASLGPPIWATERKPARKVTKAAPAVRRDTPAAANALAMRNDGYAALRARRYRDALTLLQQATIMGDPDAPMYIGQIFENGIGVARDVGQASYWYGIAINRGNGAALTAFNRMRVNPY